MLNTPWPKRSRHGCRTALRWVAVLCVLLLVTLPSVGCGPSWELAIDVDDERATSVTAKGWGEIAGQVPTELRDRSLLPLERALWESGVEAVAQVAVEDRLYDWASIHDSSWLGKSGQLEIAGQTWTPATIEVTTPKGTRGIIAHIIDLAPTMAGGLGVHSPKETSGRALAAFPADQVILVVIDGLGLTRYRVTKGQRVTPLLDSLGEAKAMLTVYPSLGEVALAALLTGTTPVRNGVRQVGATRISAQTLLETVAEAGQQSVVIVSKETPWSLSPAKLIVSPSDQAVAESALATIRGELPDLLVVHLQGLPAVTAQYGFYSDEEVATLNEIDGYLSRILTTVPQGSMMIVCGSHGLHPGDEESAVAGVAAESGTLLEDDMVVPLWILQI